MSYCRFSCDDFQCDVYVYEHVAGGFLTHVAKSRPVFAEPLPPAVPFARETVREWTERHKQVLSMVQAAERRTIGLPHDGATFEDTTAGECADRLEQLKALGYNVPQYAIDALREEDEGADGNADVER